MLKASDNAQLWAIQDQSTGQPLLACGVCLDRAQCGGLQIAAGGADAMDCMSMCRCEDPEKCDVVCPNAPRRFVKRIHEVRSFDLSVVPVAKGPALPRLPELAVLVEGNVIGSRPTKLLAYAAVPLSMTVVHARANAHPKTRRELEQTFGVSPREGWIATGVEKDAHVEKMWKLPHPKRTYEALKHAGVIFATTPNFSTMADVPRHDNLHAMMRIAWVWYEMTEAGLPTALHLNGRTDFDFVRWGQFAKRQPALHAVAFEFLTGAEAKESGRRYVARLKRFAEECGREDLLLVLRGGANWIEELKTHFPRVLLIDSGPYFKTVMRQQQVVGINGKPQYKSHKTSSNSEMRALFLHNAKAKLALHARATERASATQGEFNFGSPGQSTAVKRAMASDPRQADLFPDGTA